MTDIINILANSDLSAYSTIARAQNNLSHILDIVPSVTIFFAIFWKCNFIGKEAKGNLIITAITTVISCLLWLNFTSNVQQVSSANFGTLIMGCAMSFACAFATLCLNRSFRTAVFCSSLLIIIGGPIILVIFIVLSVWMSSLSVIICLFAWLRYLYALIRNWEKPTESKTKLIYISTAIIIPVIITLINPGKYFIKNNTFIDHVLNINTSANNNDVRNHNLILVGEYGRKTLSTNDSPTYISERDFHYLTKGEYSGESEDMFMLSKNDRGSWSITPFINSLLIDGNLFAGEWRIKNGSTLKYAKPDGETLEIRFKYEK